jgi:HEAT repeat protein
MRPRRPIPTPGDLIVPRRPAGMAPDQGDDYAAAALLGANGYTDDPAELIDLLTVDLGILQAAAARRLGARGERVAVDALERLARDSSVDETARVQAAYALERMDVPGVRECLTQLLELSVETSPAPAQAAGALARLGDPRGFTVVRGALDSPNPVTAMVATNQLHSFVPHDGRELPDGQCVDAYGAFARALERIEPNIVGEARAQLAALDSDRARAMLADR